MANRASLLEEKSEAGRHRLGKSILVEAQEHIERLDWLRPDLAAEDEQMITSLCQFDMLNCLVVVDNPVGKRTGSFLAELCSVVLEPYDPVVVAVIEDEGVRQAIFPPV